MEKVFHVEHFFCILFGCFKNYLYLCSRFKNIIYGHRFCNTVSK